MSVVWLEDSDGQPAELPAPPAVVLLHFTVPYRHAAHVVLEIRAGRTGRTGKAWRLLRAAARAGPVRIARVWICASAAEAGERIAAVQSAGGRGRYCPVCRARGAQIGRTG